MALHNAPQTISGAPLDIETCLETSACLIGGEATDQTVMRERTHKAAEVEVLHGTRGPLKHLVSRPSGRKIIF